MVLLQSEIIVSVAVIILGYWSVATCCFYAIDLRDKTRRSLKANYLVLARQDEAARAAIPLPPNKLLYRYFEFHISANGLPIGVEVISHLSKIY